jgi:hypothetical protein
MKMMRFLTDSDRVVVDIHPEREEPEFVSICPMCTLPLVLGGYIAEQRTSDPDVRVFVRDIPGKKFKA